MGEFWRDSYETYDIEEQFEDIWQTVLPLYQQLHAYIRRYAEKLLDLCMKTSHYIQASVIH